MMGEFENHRKDQSVLKTVIITSCDHNNISQQ